MAWPGHLRVLIQINSLIHQTVTATYVRGAGCGVKGEVGWGCWEGMDRPGWSYRSRGFPHTRETHYPATRWRYRLSGVPGRNGTCWRAISAARRSEHGPKVSHGESGTCHTLRFLRRGNKGRRVGRSRFYGAKEWTMRGYGRENWQPCCMAMDDVKAGRLQEWASLEFSVTFNTIKSPSRKHPAMK